MFDGRKVKYDVELLNDDDVHLNDGNENEYWTWSRVRVSACYDGVKDIVGDDCIHFYSRVDTAVNWVPRYLDLLKKGARRALYAKLADAADQFGLDALIDPYEGDPCNEISDLADSAIYPSSGEGAVYAKYEGEGLSMKLSGTVERVLTILRAAHGRD